MRPHGRVSRPRARTAPAGHVVAPAQLLVHPRWRRSVELRARLRRGLLPAAILATVAGLVWAALASSWFDVDRVQVAGLERLDESQVLTAARIDSGTPLAWPDVDGVRRRVGALPPVADVAVERRWPGTLRLVVTERVPAVVVEGPGGAQLLDETGVAFVSLPSVSSAPKGTVLLRVPSPGTADPTTAAALQVLRELPPALRARVAEVKAASPVSVVLLLRDKRSITWGAPSDAATKAASVELLLRMPGRELDVSSPQVVVRR